MGTVVWRFEILDASPETVAEWLAYTSGTELSSIVRIKDTPYYLTRHRVGWAETPYRVLLPVWGPLPLKEQLTPWSIQCEINEVNEGTAVVARYNAGDGLLEQFDHLMSALRERWPGAKGHQAIEMRTDSDSDRAIDDYFEGSARLFIDWLAERIGSGLLLEATDGWAISVPPPRVGHINTLETLAVDVELLEVKRRGEEEDVLQQIDRCPESIRFSARAYNRHKGTIFRVQSTCHDLYRANCEEVRDLQDILGMGRIDKWPIVEPPPVAAFFEGLWEQIRASWQSPEQGLLQKSSGAGETKHSMISSDDNESGVKRGPNMGTIEKVAQARVLWQWMEERGRGSQSVACDLAGTTPPTLRKYYDDPRVIERMEELSNDERFRAEFSVYSGKI
jgi:hypothetical protein